MTPEQPTAARGSSPRLERFEVALGYLAHRHVMTIATSGDSGPDAAAVFYATVGLDLVFLSAPTTRHSRNLEMRPQVAITIQDQETEWRQIRGLQLLGTVERLDGDDADRAADAFMARFPGIFGTSATSQDIARALARIRWYRVRLDHLRFIDNSRGLGGVDEWTRAELLATRTGQVPPDEAPGTVP